MHIRRARQESENKMIIIGDSITVTLRGRERHYWIESNQTQWQLKRRDKHKRTVTVVESRNTPFTIEKVGNTIQIICLIERKQNISNLAKKILNKNT